MLNLVRIVWERGIPCIFHAVTGLYCPGCGGTRALKVFLKGDFWLSFQYHPIIVYTVVIVLLEAAAWLLAKLLKKPELQLRHYDLFVYMGIAILLINWIYKNYMLIAKGIDMLPI